MSDLIRQNLTRDDLLLIVDAKDAEIAALRSRLAETEASLKLDRKELDERCAWLDDANGALDDARVGRNPDDDIASGIEALAKDRDELLAEWNAVGSIFWPNREPDDGWSHHEIADEVKGLRKRAEAAEARVAELEAALGVWAQAHDGTDYSCQTEASAQLRALLARKGGA